MSQYSDRIRAIEPDLDPAPVEAFMRLEHGTLDQLDENAFVREVRSASLCVRSDPEQGWELAASYGLTSP